MIKRKLANKLLQLYKKFPIVGIWGPRQSGKTTLAKSTFQNLPYINLESPDIRHVVQSDPRGFLRNYTKGLIIDEAQYVPELFSYLQVISDERAKTGQYVLTGSQNFLLNEKVSQSLAGRIALTTLLPTSFEEIADSKYAPKKQDSMILNGFYPRVLIRKINSVDFYPNYIQTYIERDVRQIKNIENLGIFQKFLKMCAGRVGQILNLSSLANDCGINHVTAKQWISILESSYIVFLLRPHHKNFGKRLVKSPKLYFIDTGIACNLLEITDPKQLSTHYARGSLFENWVISEYMKSRYNSGLGMNGYYWRDNIGNEVDLLIEEKNQCIPVEVKSGQSLNSDFYKSLKYYTQISGQKLENSNLVYGGDVTFQDRNGRTIAWKNLPELWK